MIFTYSLFVLLNRNPEFGINGSDLTNKICKYYFLKVYRFCTNAKSTRFLHFPHAIAKFATSDKNMNRKYDEWQKITRVCAFRRDCISLSAICISGLHSPAFTRHQGLSTLESWVTHDTITNL